MQEENADTADSNEVKSVIATLRNFSPEKPIENAVIYFWESHTKLDDEARVQATVELIYKEFDLHACEKYEARTGYLSRYNYLSKPINECSAEEIEEAVIKGKQEQINWLNICKPELPEFKAKNWQECIFKDENPYFEQCKYLVLEEIKNNKEFEKAVSDSVNEFANNHGTDRYNGNMYVVEEVSWILSLPLMHINKPIFLIHVGSANYAVSAAFQHFPNLKKAVKWLSPRFNETIFKNESDFLLDYRSSPHVGYSYALENPESVKRIKQFKKADILTREELLHTLDHEQAEKNLFRSMLEKLPGHVYWLNRDNVYLGCNEQQAGHLGLNSPSEIIGKTNKAFHTEKGADILDKTNTVVMETGKAFEGEEFLSFTDAGHRYCLTHKTPLFDTHGKVIGLLGISVDITDRKRVEELEIQNRIQKKFQKVADQVIHDIRTPLQVLLHVLKSCKNLSEKEHVMLRDSVDSIKNIAREFLEYSFDKKESFEYQHILVSQTLTEILNQKKRQYIDKKIDFQYSFAPSLKFVFIYGNALNFERMMSNIIDNSVESFDEEKGIIKIGFSANGGNVKITIQDTGKGMPPETVEKLMKGESVSTTKQGGFGIGTTQIRDTINELKGKQFIESEQNVGTKITLTIPKSDNPNWFLKKITLNKGDTVIILDDDVSMHGLFKKILEPYSGDISLKFFENGQATVDFINSFEEKDRLVLLTDYELRKQELNGLSVIEESAVDSAKTILVTGIYNRKEIQEKAELSGVKILPKSLVEDVEIVLNDVSSGV
jgi:PAS domain S-box-containing protein